MKGDHLSFKRAASVSLLGLALQLALALTMLVYATVHADQAGIAAAAFMLCGVPIWLCLAIVFDQHRRERLEALEAETIERTGVAGSSVFQQTGDDLRVAARRLAWMHKYMLPGVSLVLAAILMAVGYWRFRVSMYDYQVLTQEIKPAPHGFLIALGITMGAVGFLFARFVSGMAKQKIWANLRAGAAQSVGAALLGIGIAIAHGAFLGGSDTLFRYIHVVYPIIMIVLGVEMVLNFILTVYRPRRPGEIPRPAFDSRILGFVAAPDRLAESIGGALNYQFGFDVTGSWFYQLLSRSLAYLIFIGAAVVWVMTFFAVIRPGEQGLRIRNGQLIGDPIEPGLVFKRPWPFEAIERKSTKQIHQLNLGSPEPGDVKSLLWTNSHKVVEKYMIVQPSDTASGVTVAPAVVPVAAAAPGAGAKTGAETGGGAARNQIKDIALVSVEVPLLYQVDDLLKYENLAQEGMRDSLLEAVGRREVLKYLATQKMDDVLGAGRAQATTELTKRIQQAYGKTAADGTPGLDAGVTVLFVGIAGVHPPTLTAATFEEVVGSFQKRRGAVESAHTDETSILTKAVGSVPLAKQIVAEIDTLSRLQKGLKEDEPLPEAVVKQQQKVEDLLATAGGDAAVTIQKAKAERWALHMSARSRADRYSAQLASYHAAKEVYMWHNYFDMLKDVLGKARVYIAPDGQSTPMEVWVEAKDNMDFADVFKGLTKEE